MRQDSASSFSSDSNTSSESRTHQDIVGSTDHQVRGLSDIFAPSLGLTRSFLSKRSSNAEEICLLRGTDVICRICHGGNSSGDLLTACHCRGSIALVHLRCLQIWLNESSRNQCELCQYRFKIIKKPKYGVLKSIFIFLRNPGPYFKELIIDVATLLVYTPSTIGSTYLLMILGENLAKVEPEAKNGVLAHVLAFTTLFGVAAINFTYTSWLILTLEKYVFYWSEWYKQHVEIKIILSEHKIEIPVNLNFPPESRDVQDI